MNTQMLEQLAKFSRFDESLYSSGEMHMIAHGNHSPPRGPPLRAAPSEMFENPLCSVLTQGDHDEDEGENEYEVQDPGRVTEHDPAWRAGGTTLQGHSTQQFTEADPIKVDPSRKVELVLRLVAREDEKDLVFPKDECKPLSTLYPPAVPE
ncbi:uncharacterized protein LOC144649993 isoform X2 [Oculina patagonica]